MAKLSVTTDFVTDLLETDTALGFNCGLKLSKHQEPQEIKGSTSKTSRVSHFSDSKLAFPQTFEEFFVGSSL